MLINIIPDLNVDNHHVASFFTNIHKYYNLYQQVFKKKKQFQITYEILLSKDKYSFNLIFPDEDKELILNELNICWDKCTYKNGLDHLSYMKITDAKEYELKNHYFLSLKVNHTNDALFPLVSWLESTKLLKQDEKALIQIILVAEQPEWNQYCEQYIKDFNNGYLHKRFKLDKTSVLEGVMKAGYTVLNETYSILDELVTGETAESEPIDKINNEWLYRKGLSNNTLKKSSYPAYDMSFRIAIQCSENRKELLSNAFNRPVNELSEDNSLIIRPAKKDMLIKAIKKREGIEKWNDDLVSAWELGQIIQLPTKAYQTIYHITNIDTRETDLPKELLNGKIAIGTNTHRGLRTMTYWYNSFDIMSLPKVIVGPEGAGKTKYITRFAVEAGTYYHQAVIVIDYIKNCELSNEIKEHTKAPVITINLSDAKNFFALAFNEVKIYDGDSNWRRLEKANMLAEQTKYLINSLTTEETAKLTAKMSHYLTSACMIVYINPNEKIDNAMNVLMHYKIRHEYIDKALKSGIFSDNDLEIIDMEELDDKDGGTKEKLIEGIIDRFSILRQNLYLRQMMKADAQNNINLLNYIEQGYTILIQIPETCLAFTKKQAKDTLVTFFLSKIWLCMQLRGDQAQPKICHVITDEIHHLTTASKLLSETIDESRKYGCSYVFTVHFLDQFKYLLESVKSSGVSYMLLGGTEKQNYNALKEEMAPFSIEEALQTKPYHSLNIINYGNKKAIYDSELPKPLA